MPIDKLLIRVLEFFVVALIAAMVVMVFGNVVLRFGFNSGIPQTEELSRYAFVWLTFMAAVIGLAEGTHLGMDTVVRYLSERARRVCRGVCDAAMLACCVLFAIGSYHQTIANAGRHAQASNFPLVLLFVVGLVTSVLMMLILALDLYRLATGRLRADRLVQVGSGE
ncbi:MAG: TRAP transporter small permease [Burkholderiales bacterium]